MNKELIKKCLDIGSWKHSWHNKLQTENDFIAAKSTIEDLIRERKQEIIMLKDGLFIVKNEIDSYKNDNRQNI